MYIYQIPCLSVSLWVSNFNGIIIAVVYKQPFVASLLFCDLLFSLHVLDMRIKFASTVVCDNNRMHCKTAEFWSESAIGWLAICPSRLDNVKVTPGFYRSQYRLLSLWYRLFSISLTRKTSKPQFSGIAKHLGRYNPLRGWFIWGNRICVHIFMIFGPNHQKG